MLYSEMPLIGLGTWMLRGDECIDVCKRAYAHGYRHFDTAFQYENHKEIGTALKEFPREEIFITSKFAFEDSRDPHLAITRALNELGTDYIDLFLIHWPDDSVDMQAVFKGMDHEKQKGRVRAIGLSNFNPGQIEMIAETGIKIDALQIELHPLLQQTELQKVCSKYGIKIISFRTLGKGNLLNHPQIIEIAQRSDCSVAQLLLHWTTIQGISVVPKARSDEHLKANLDISDISISFEDQKILGSLESGKRFCQPDRFLSP